MRYSLQWDFLGYLSELLLLDYTVIDSEGKIQ